jgi:hypothetical protein
MAARPFADEQPQKKESHVLLYSLLTAGALVGASLAAKHNMLGKTAKGWYDSAEKSVLKLIGKDKDTKTNTPAENPPRTTPPGDNPPNSTPPGENQTPKDAGNQPVNQTPKDKNTPANPPANQTPNNTNSAEAQNAAPATQQAPAAEAQNTAPATPPAPEATTGGNKDGVGKSESGVERFVQDKRWANRGNSFPPVKQPEIPISGSATTDEERAFLDNLWGRNAKHSGNISGELGKATTEATSNASPKKSAWSKYSRERLSESEAKVKSIARSFRKKPQVQAGGKTESLGK